MSIGRKKTKYKIYIQPVPRGNWGDNLATLLPEEVWIWLRKEIHKRGKHQCELCGDILTTLHCHESWYYDDKAHTQTLYSLMSICRECHNCIHWFRTEGEVRKGNFPAGYITELRNHFIKVNECSRNQFNSHLEWCMIKMNTRMRFPYTINYGKYSVEKIMAAYQKGEIR